MALFENVRQFANTPVFREPVDAPQGGGFSGGLSRFARGFQQGVLPNRGQVVTRGLNPMAYLFGGIGEGLGDAVRGSSWWQRLSGGSQGAPLPRWMQPGAPMGEAPPAPQWRVPQFGEQQGQGESLEGRGPSYGIMPTAPQRGYQGNRAGTRGTTIAEGQDAQDMAQGFQDAARAEYMQSLQRQFRNRMDTILK